MEVAFAIDVSLKKVGLFSQAAVKVKLATGKESTINAVSLCTFTQPLVEVTLSVTVYFPGAVKAWMGC